MIVYLLARSLVVLSARVVERRRRRRDRNDGRGDDGRGGRGGGGGSELVLAA
jgi:hypothetical protein